MFAYRYHFSNGETISIDVSNDWGEILIDLDRQEYNNNHKETRRHYSLEGKVYEGMDYAVEDSGLEALFAGPTDEECLRTAIQQLTPDQQEMVQAIYFENVSVNDYAARMGVTQSAISHRLQTVKKIEKTSEVTLIISLSLGRISEGARKQPSRKDERHET